MITQQTAWPCFPLTLPYEVTLPPYAASDHAGLVVPSRATHRFNTAIDKPSLKESRKFFLDRSVFDLVHAHPYLSLTDPELLSWYLCLSPEDRKIIQDEGGFHQFLQRHPALELSRHHVYVKYNSHQSVQPTVTSHKHKSKTGGVKTCRCEMPHTNLELEMLHRHVPESSLLGCSNSGGASEKQPHQETCHTKLIHLQDRFSTAHDSPITPSHRKAHKERSSLLSELNGERPPWPTASSLSRTAACKHPAFSVDMDMELELELERGRQMEKPELRSQMSVTQRQSADLSQAEVSPLQSEWPTTEKESVSEYCSFDSMEMEDREYNAGSIIQSVDSEQVNSPKGPVEENSTKAECQDYMVSGNEHTVDNNEASLSLEDHSDSFHSLMEDDKSILVCLPCEDLKAQHNGAPLSWCEAPADTSETMESDQPVTRRSTSERCTSPVPCVPTCDIMVGTEDPETADKNVITEVHMADLDYLAEEFIKLRTAQVELRERKEEMKSSGCKLRQECDCIQRAQQAELCLLALQYSMCRQHLWRLYYTSAEGDQLIATHGDMNQYWPKGPPANILGVLHELESDYNHMRDKILGGTPLDQLKPLSVESEKITTRASYIPAQIGGDVLGNLPSWSSLEPQECSASHEENRCPSDQSSNGCQVKKERSKARRAVTRIPQDRGANHDACKPQEEKTKSACKELNASEAWYDAEEDLELAGLAVAAEKGQHPTVSAKSNESASEEANSSVLCVSNLPSNVTESDVMLCFEKYHASEVSICVLKNDLRVAIVMVSGSQSAKAAVRELNGFSMDGHTLHVEHINRAVGGSQSQSQASASISDPESPQDATKPQPPDTQPNSSDRTLTSQPPLSSSIKNRKVICTSPTAKGTCVPQHYGTMGSFHTLMAELSQLHPDVGRQRIVDALMELMAKHQGVLISLPLVTIREMTSELLTRPASVTQS